MMSKHKTYCNVFHRALFIALFFVSHFLSAQFYQIRNFNSENGLPSPEVYGMLQDSKGYMWFGTDMGVSRYNGYEFKNFSTENGLPDNTIFGFCEDAKGRIWFRSFSGKLSYFLNDSIHIVACNPLLEKEVKKRALLNLSMYVDEGDTIWLGTTERVVEKISPPWKEKNVEWINVLEEGGYLFIINDKALVFGGNSPANRSLSTFTKDGKKIIKINLGINPVKRLRGKYYGTRLQDGTFLASVNDIILRFNKNGIISSTKEKAMVIAMVEDKNKKFISASYDGIRIHEINNLNHYETIPDFTDKTFTDILIDRENGLWCTAEGQGIFYIPFRSGRYYTTEHGLSQSKISCITEKNGKIITGHLNGTITVIGKNVLESIGFNSQKFAAISSNRINCIYTDEKREFYANNSFSTYKLTINDLKKYKEIEDAGAKKIIKDKGNIVYVLRDRHLIRCDISNNFKQLNGIIFKQYVDNIYKDKNGIVWICAMNGLWVYKKDSLYYLGDKNKLLSSRIVNVLEDNKGRIWMSSRGIGVIVKQGNKFYQIKQENGLASNMCRNMFIDSNNVVWVGSNNGLSKISPGNENNTFTYKVDVFTKRNGLLTNEINFILGRGNELLLAHNNGISIFNPASLKNNMAPPPIYITGTSMNNVFYKGDSLNLNYSKNYLKIDYVGLSYKNPGSLEYKYKMEGIDTSWVYTKYTSAQFQTLLPGDYKFIVYAKNDDGYWSASPATLLFTIHPAWWQTWLFKLSGAVILFLFIALLFKQRLNIIERRERLKTIQQSRMAAAELKALRAQMNPHFVFNAINSVQYFITNNDPKSSQKYLSKFAKLIRYVVDNSKPAAILLEKELDALRLYLDLESLRFENRFEYNISIHNNVDMDYIQIPSMMIQPYVENAIWHGLMHKKGKGKIDITLRMEDTILKCTIEDNGIGREKSKEIKSQQSETTHKSIGMSITKERLDIVNQLNNSKLSVNITDLKDEQGNACGTRVELTIPSY